ncbi:unnamed protein product [Commensalibacter communis]|uniref:hypothetical protein n=1 Tax=Commensalibacter communis TaxID=2972786 RepID=UPI0022FFC33B|nr:hypothetical protein [Commensalibacter communis]CAI3959852.1 unnamed protein product [Commensalibacter communis]
MYIYPSNGNLYFSKGTWKIESNIATCYNSGANFCFTTDAFVKGNKNIILNFDMPNVTKGYAPILAWRINGLMWQYAHITNQMIITLPASQNDATESPVMNGIANHYVEIWVRTISLQKPRWTWNGQVNNNIVTLNSLEIADNAKLFETTLNDITMLSIGASFTEGYGTVGTEHADFKSNDVTCCWGVLLGNALGFNVATSGYAGSGFFAHGNGNSPPVGIAYKYMDNGIPRDYTGIDIAAFNIGANDSGVTSTDFIAAAIQMIDDLRKHYPNMILLFTTPFWGQHQTDWLKIADIYKEDKKIIYLNTVYPQLSGHPTITNYKQYILPDLIKQARNALFNTNIWGGSQEIIKVQSPIMNQNVNIKVDNLCKNITIKRV